MKRIGYWISEKKSKKLNFEAQRNMFRNAGIDLQKIDLTHSLEEQGPFDAILNKLADVLTQANMGNTEAQQHIQNIQNYIFAHPECIVIDPFSSVRRLLNRYTQYNHMLQSQLVKEESDIFVPPFVELLTNDVERNKRMLTDAGVTFPFVSKTSIAQGSELSHKAFLQTCQVDFDSKDEFLVLDKSIHVENVHCNALYQSSMQMAVIFNEDGLKDISVPCVAQSFINHNAVLFKIYVIGERQFIAQRPSLKNFNSTDHETIFFDSHDVSKPTSAHFLNKLDAVDLENSPLEPSIERLKEMGVMLRKVLNMDLFGVDIIIDSETHKHAIIDVNIFPGYDEVEDFFQVLLDHMLQVFREHDAQSHQSGETEKLLTLDSTRIEHLDNCTTKNLFQKTSTPSCKKFKSELGQFKHSSNINGDPDMHSSELECKNGIQQFSNSFLVNNSKEYPS